MMWEKTKKKYRSIQLEIQRENKFHVTWRIHDALSTAI